METLRRPIQSVTAWIRTEEHSAVKHIDSKGKMSKDCTLRNPSVKSSRSRGSSSREESIQWGSRNTGRASCPIFIFLVIPSILRAFNTVCRQIPNFISSSQTHRSNCIFNISFSCLTDISNLTFQNWISDLSPKAVILTSYLSKWQYYPSIFSNQ